MQYLIGYGYLAVVFVLAFLMQNLLRLSVEITRKLTHIMIGFTWVILYYFFILPPHVHPLELLVLPVSFIIINALSYRYKIFTMIERDGEGNHPGTVYYAVAITLLMACTLLYPETCIPSGIAVFCLSFGDGFAALFGGLFGKYGPRITKDKSLIGSLSCFGGAVLGTYLLMLFVPFEIPFWGVLLIGLATALLELVGGGLDNFAITFGVTALATLLLGGYSNGFLWLLLSLGIGLLIAILTYLLHALTKGGALAALISVSGSLYFGGFSFFAVLLFSFLTISVVGKLTHKKRDAVERGIPEKEGARDFIQVAVNGFPALLSLAVGAVTGHMIFVFSFTAAIAEALADSMASEIGVLSKRQPRDICTWRRVPAGMSGGVTWLGFFAALFGAALPVLLAALLMPAHPLIYVLMLLAAVFGVLVDSVLGSRLQRKRTCTVCGKATEKAVHCQCKTEHAGGLRFLSNDLVNAVSNLSSLGASLLLLMIVL